MLAVVAELVVAGFAALLHIVDRGSDVLQTAALGQRGEFIGLGLQRLLRLGEFGGFEPHLGLGVAGRVVAVGREVAPGLAGKLLQLLGAGDELGPVKGQALPRHHAHRLEGARELLEQQAALGDGLAGVRILGFVIAGA